MTQIGAIRVLEDEAFCGVPLAGRLRSWGSPCSSSLPGLPSGPRYRDFPGWNWSGHWAAGERG